MLANYTSKIVPLGKMPPKAYSSEARHFTQLWGWKSPPEKILDLAEQTVEMQRIKSGEALVALGAISLIELERILKGKPHDQKILEYAALIHPSIRPLVEKILTLRASVPFYDSLELLTLHEAMKDHPVQTRCDELDAVLMVIDDAVPVLVFSTYAAMMEFNGQGREARRSDTVRSKVAALTETELRTAVGKRDEVIAALSISRGVEGNNAADVQSTLWNSASVTDRFQKALTRILDYSIAQGATDIEIEPRRGGGALVMMRLHGDMTEIPAYPMLNKEEYEQIVNFLLAKSGANPSATRVGVPKDGQISYRNTAGDAYLRLSFLPLLHHGTDLEMISVSIRIQAATAKAITLSSLHVAPTVQEELRAAAIKDYGLILVVGATNTGKSTTILGAVHENVKQYGNTKKRISLEQPIERISEDLIQINVPERLIEKNEKVDAFELFLRAIKRHDPDVIFPSEIRDSKTAEICVKAAISGHLVFSTYHATDTILGYDGLAKTLHHDYRFQLVESLSLIVAQRLPKRICKCGKTEHPREEHVKAFNKMALRNRLGDVELPTWVRYADPDGCQECVNGFSGMLPINEVLAVSDDVKEIMLDMLDGKNRRRDLQDARTVTMFQSAMELVKKGEIEITEALK
jgi:type II secretory ATPase GspE/PulE/Tfp pilus assembly ATPase PilB-like protein